MHAKRRAVKKTAHLADTDVVSTTVSLTKLNGVVPVTSSHCAGIVPPVTAQIYTCITRRMTHLNVTPVDTTRPTQCHLIAL